MLRFESLFNVLENSYVLGKDNGLLHLRLDHLNEHVFVLSPHGIEHFRSSRRINLTYGSTGYNLFPVDEFLFIVDNGRDLLPRK